MLWFIAGLFTVITVVLFSGRGGFLIAGYNTASKADKAKYNEKKLGIVMGGGMAVITVLIFICALYQDDLPDYMLWLMPAGIVVSTISMIILSNTVCMVKNPSAYIASKENTKTALGEKIKNYLWVIAPVTVLVIGVLSVSGDVKVSVDDTNINILGSYWPDMSIAFEEINDVTYSDNLDVGRRTNGFGSFKLSEGKFRNAQFGSYILYAYRRCSSYVILDTTDGYVVLNAKDADETMELYNNIKQELEK